MYGGDQSGSRRGGGSDLFAVGGAQDSRDRGSKRANNDTGVNNSSASGERSTSRRARPASTNADTIQSEDSGYPTGTSRSDPGGSNKKRFPSSTPGVCIDEKVLKQISENQTKFMQERITKVEEYFGNLCDGFGRYARGVAKLRDKGDAIATSVQIYANGEQLNPNTQEVLTKFAQQFSGIQDYREAEVRRIEEKVVRPLSVYGTACKQAKERMKVACSARKKELDQKKMLEKAARDPYNRTFTKAQTDLQKASVNASQADNDVEQEMEKFEERKLHDLKQVLRDFVSIEMLFHARALELFSECYSELENLTEDDDLEHFRNSLRPMTSQNRLRTQRAMSENAGTSGKNRGAASLMSTTASDASSIDSRPPRGQGQSQQSRSTKGASQPQQNRSRQPETPRSEGDDDLEDEEEEEEDYEEEEEEEEEDDDEDEDEDDLDVSALDSQRSAVQMRAKPVTSNGRK